MRLAISAPKLWPVNVTLESFGKVLNTFSTSVSRERGADDIVPVAINASFQRSNGLVGSVPRTAKIIELSGRLMTT